MPENDGSATRTNLPEELHAEGIVNRVRRLIPQQAQRQDSRTEQLRDLHILAARFGMYDAADWLWKFYPLMGTTEHPDDIGAR